MLHELWVNERDGCLHASSHSEVVHHLYCWCVTDKEELEHT